MKKKSFSIQEAFKPAIFKCASNPNYVVTIYVKDYDALIKVTEFIEENVVEDLSIYYIETFIRSYTFSNGSKFRIFVLHTLNDIVKSNIILVDDRINNHELINDIKPVIIPYEYENGMMLNPKPIFTCINSKDGDNS